MISPTDTQRTLRAYEVKIFTNKSIYKWISNTKSDFLDFDIRKIFIDVPKYHLLKNIYLRTKSMFKKGCIEEVRNFLKLGIDKSLSANKIIGVREIGEYLDGSIPISFYGQQCSCDVFWNLLVMRFDILVRWAQGGTTLKPVGPGWARH